MTVPRYDLVVLIDGGPGAVGGSRSTRMFHTLASARKEAEEAMRRGWWDENILIAPCRIRSIIVEEIEQEEKGEQDESQD